VVAVIVSLHYKAPCYHHCQEVTTEGGIFAYLNSRRSIAPPQDLSEPVHSLDLLSMPTEVLQMITDYTLPDAKAVQSVRLTCKLFKRLTEQGFRQSHLTHLHVAPTYEAFTRLLWTAQRYDIGPLIQSITVVYDVEVDALSGALCSGMHDETGGDLLLRTLEHIRCTGRKVNLNITISEAPLDNTSSVISILYRVLKYVLFSRAGHSVQKLSLDIDDTTSPVYPVYPITPLSTEDMEDRYYAKDFGPKFQPIWKHMAQIKSLGEIRVRFSKKDETDSPRFLSIIRGKEGIHVRMQWLNTWHFDIMGRMSIFSEVHSLNIQNCALNSYDNPDLFNNPNLRDLVLWNVSLCAVHRYIDHLNVASIDQEPEDWVDTLPSLLASRSYTLFGLAISERAVEGFFILSLGSSRVLLIVQPVRYLLAIIPTECCSHILIRNATEGMDFSCPQRGKLVLTTG
jgi:hypothetical protein